MYLDRRVSRANKQCSREGPPCSGYIFFLEPFLMLQQNCWLALDIFTAWSIFTRIILLFTNYGICLWQIWLRAVHDMIIVCLIYRWVEGMAPVFSKSAWQCVWHLIQVDFIFIWFLNHVAYLNLYCARQYDCFSFSDPQVLSMNCTISCSIRCPCVSLFPFWNLESGNTWNMRNRE